MNQAQPIQFNATAGSFFKTWILCVLCIFVPFVGGVLAYRVYASWLAENAAVNGRRLKLNVSFGDAFVFMFVQGIFIVLTLYIYMFWAIPKMIKFTADHIEYDDGVQQSSSPVMNPAAVNAAGQPLSQPPQQMPPTVQ